MRSAKIVCAVAAVTLGFGSLAQAQGWRAGVPPGYDPSPHVVPGPQDQPAQPIDPGWQGYRRYGEQYPYDSRQYPGDWRERHHYYRGGYVPDRYRSQRYWVRDWRARHLAPPPQGYQWVETDTGDVLLVALATGLIASIVLNQ
jgi:Ni/Co efflux regulator RcnB